jgi:hypothetical protein
LFISADEGAEKSNFTWKFIHETLNKESDVSNVMTDILINFRWKFLDSMCMDTLLMIPLYIF